MPGALLRAHAQPFTHSHLPRLPAASLARSLTADIPLVKLPTTELGPWNWAVSWAVVIRAGQLLREQQDSFTPRPKALAG